MNTGFFIRGGGELNGKVVISGAKNAALPIIAASLLTKDPIKLLGVPDLSDVHDMLALLRIFGRDFSFHSGELNIWGSSPQLRTYHESSIFKRIRASCLFLGPMLAMHRQAFIKTPGGCAIGKRPIDLHLYALEKMGANLKVNNDTVSASTINGLHGATIEFCKKSVGATQNTIMAAVLADGVTIIKNAAIEPEVTDLINFLIKIGAKIDGAGTRELKINGTSSLGGGEYRIIPDRIEAGTYLTMVAAAGGKIVLENVERSHLQSFIEKLNQTKALKITYQDTTITAQKIGEVCPVDISTESYPGFPTDLQPQFMALLCTANGESIVEENIFENRFMHVPELKKMGAKIEMISSKIAKITGTSKLYGADLTATDLRGGCALIVAALAANGESIIRDSSHIDRGYECIKDKICGLKKDAISSRFFADNKIYSR